jgi:hypothetical protein
MQLIPIAGCSQISVLAGMYPKGGVIAGETVPQTLKRQAEEMTTEILKHAAGVRLLICSTNAGQPQADGAIRAAGGYIVEHSLGSSKSGIKIWVIPGKVSGNDKYTKEKGHIQRATEKLQPIDTDHAKLNSPAVLAKEQGKRKKKPGYWKARYLALIKRTDASASRRKKNSKKK